MSELPPHKEDEFDPDQMDLIDFLMIMENVSRDTAGRALKFREEGEVLKAEFFGRVALDLQNMVTRWTSIIENPGKYHRSHVPPDIEQPPTIVNPE
jgi:hypothetical protein